MSRKTFVPNKKFLCSPSLESSSNFVKESDFFTEDFGEHHYTIDNMEIRRSSVNNISDDKRVKLHYFVD